MTRKSEVLGSISGLATYFCFSFHWFKRGSCQLLTKYVHKVLVNRSGGLSLPRKSVVRLTDHPDMTLDVYPGRKTTTQQQLYISKWHYKVFWCCIECQYKECWLFTYSVLDHNPFTNGNQFGHICSHRSSYRISSIIRRSCFLPKQSQKSRSIL